MADRAFILPQRQAVGIGLLCHRELEGDVAAMFGRCVADGRGFVSGCLVGRWSGEVKINA